MDDEFAKFYNKALRFLSFRPRSEKEVVDNLKKTFRRGLGPSEAAIELIIKKLKDYKFLDDLEFAKMWVAERSLLKLKPLRVIKFELKQKGITEEIIEQVLSDSKEEKGDLEKAKKIIDKKISKYLPAGRQVKGLEKQKIREKLGRFLASRGFDYDTIKEAIDGVLTKGV